MNIDIGICTFRRDSLYGTLESLAAQQGPDSLTLRIIVADNDEQPLKQAEIEAQAKELGLNLWYVHAPARNISIALSRASFRLRPSCKRTVSAI